MENVMKYNNEGTQLEYRGVVILPRTYSIEEYVKQDREYYQRIGYTVNMTAPITSAEKRNYWRNSKWYIFFENGRVVEVPAKKGTETFATYALMIDKRIAKVEKESTTDLGRFSCLMQRLLNKTEFKNAISVYPTQYGIGIWAIWNWNLDSIKAKINALLDSMGVQYENEYSDAEWVYRYKISKKEANRILIEKNV